jgi:hypothetical protein
MFKVSQCGKENFPIFQRPLFLEHLNTLTTHDQHRLYSSKRKSACNLVQVSTPEVIICFSYGDPLKDRKSPRKNKSVVFNIFVRILF